MALHSWQQGHKGTEPPFLWFVHHTRFVLYFDQDLSHFVWDLWSQDPGGGVKSTVAGCSGLIFPGGHVHLSQVSRKHFPSPYILHGAGPPFRMTLYEVQFSSVQFSSIAQSCLTPCNPMDCRMPGFPVTNSQSLLKLMSIESLMPSSHLILCRLLLPSIFPSIRVFSNESVLMATSGGQSIGASASVLPMNIQDWFPLGWTGLISLQSKGLSRVFFNTTVQKHQFFSAQLSLWSVSHIHIWLLEKP